MKYPGTLLMTLLCCLMTPLLQGCGGGSSSQQNNTVTPEEPADPEQPGEPEEPENPTDPDDPGAPAAGLSWQRSFLLGQAQKGPLQQGAVVTVQALNQRGRVDPDVPALSGEVDALGRFLVEPPAGQYGATGWVEVSVAGDYFSEATGQYVSGNGFRLSMMAPIKQGRIEGNLNVLTRFLLERTRHLLDNDAALSLERARAVALGDMADTFHIHLPPERLTLLASCAATLCPRELLNEMPADERLTGSTADNQLLLLYATAFLEAGISANQYQDMVASFAQLGRFSSSNAAGELMLDVLRHMYPAPYETARQHLHDNFGRAPAGNLFSQDQGRVLPSLYCGAGALCASPRFADSGLFTLNANDPDNPSRREGVALIRVTRHGFYNVASRQVGSADSPTCNDPEHAMSIVESNTSLAARLGTGSQHVRLPLQPGLDYFVYMQRGCINNNAPVHAVSVTPDDTHETLAYTNPATPAVLLDESLLTWTLPGQTDPAGASLAHFTFVTSAEAVTRHLTIDSEYTRDQLALTLYQVTNTPTPSRQAIATRSVELTQRHQQFLFADLQPDTRYDLDIERTMTQLRPEFADQPGAADPARQYHLQWGTTPLPPDQIAEQGRATDNVLYHYAFTGEEHEHALLFGGPDIRKLRVTLIDDTSEPQQRIVDQALTGGESVWLPLPVEQGRRYQLHMAVAFRDDLDEADIPTSPVSANLILHQTSH